VYGSLDVPAADDPAIRTTTAVATDDADIALVADKDTLRRRIRAERRARGAGERARLGERLAEIASEVIELHRPSCVALYASVGGEPDTNALRAWLRRRGIRVLLPVVLGRTLGWAPDDGVLQDPPPGVRGGPVPTTLPLPGTALAGAEVVLLPALAVDTLGNRLGQGGGFYDRALAHANPAALIAAIVHDNELLDAAVEPVPVEPHDRPVAAALSPSRWHPFDPFVDVR